MRFTNYHHLDTTRLSIQAYIGDLTATEQEKSKDGWEKIPIKYTPVLTLKGA